MKLVFIGATHEVTGSCTYLEACGKRILIDFGMEQGRDTYENVRIPCTPGEIDYVLLTHAHIDHSGLLPLLFAGGFTGSIHATDATTSLCSIMLRDSAHIQEFEAEWRNRKAKRTGAEPYVPLYTMQEALGAIDLFVPHPYDRIETLCPGIQIRFVDAGHLLGSSSIEIWLTEQDTQRKLVFSGDIGNYDQPLLRDPQYLTEADYVVMESTYGNRLHDKPKAYEPALAEILESTFAKGGSVIIPSFAVGRTQEMLYFLKRVKEAHLVKTCPDFPVYVDSPLAIEATEIFQKNQKSCFDEEAMEYVRRGENPIGVSNLHVAVTSDASRAINFDTSCKVILLASCMCEAGRIKHHLKHNLWKPENTILFVGYQAEGTLGRRLLEGAQTVTIFGEPIQVAARICKLPGLSGHADQSGLRTWASKLKDPKKFFVIHGETSAADDFTRLLQQELGRDAYAPYSGTEFDLIRGEFLYEAPPVPIPGKSTGKANGSACYRRLETAMERLESLVRSRKGYSNKELAKMADQLSELCAKWER